MRISDWSSRRVLFRSRSQRRNILVGPVLGRDQFGTGRGRQHAGLENLGRDIETLGGLPGSLRQFGLHLALETPIDPQPGRTGKGTRHAEPRTDFGVVFAVAVDRRSRLGAIGRVDLPLALQLGIRSEEHTSELQSLIRISYAVLCLKKKNNNN